MDRKGPQPMALATVLSSTSIPCRRGGVNVSRWLARHQIKYRLGDEPLQAVQNVPIDVAPISPSSDPGRKLVGAGGYRKIAAYRILSGSSKAAEPCP